MNKQSELEKQLEEVFEKNNDPIEQERSRIKKNKEKRAQDKKKDYGIE